MKRYISVLLAEHVLEGEVTSYRIDQIKPSKQWFEMVEGHSQY